MKLCFAGHRDAWHCVGVEELIIPKLKSLISQGYDTFFDGGLGEFDTICLNALIDLKKVYPQIKIIKVLTHYNAKKKYSQVYDEVIMPDIENVFYKQLIIQRNKWIVDNSDGILCHIENEFNSGAYNMLKYALKKGLNIYKV